MLCRTCYYLSHMMQSISTSLRYPLTPNPNNFTQKKKMLSSSFSYVIGFVKINPLLFPTNRTQFTIFNQLSSPRMSNLQVSTQSRSRRNLLNNSMATIVISSVAPFLSSRSSLAEAEELLELERYTDMNEGFTLLRPKSWIKIEKAGATVLFEDPVKGSNNVGVVVTPVRLTSLGEFGDPQFVSSKLIQAEKRKESTKDVEIVSFMERPGENGDTQVYEFEYKLDSTRGGLKTIFSAAFVASKKLHLLNIAHSDNPQQPLDNHTRMMLERVLHSFDVVNNR